MKVLGIYSSPRSGGNSDLLLDKALEGSRSEGAEIKTIHACKLKIEGCRECGECDKTGECVIDDDMDEVYPLLEDADAIILATPVFFYGPPAQLKALIDRCQALWNRRKIRKKGKDLKKHESGSGWLIAVGATKGEKLFDAVGHITRYFLDALDMSCEGGLFFRGVEGKADIRNRPGALEDAFELGRKISRGKME